MKRIFDISFSFLVIILLSPIIALVSLAIKIGSKGPVLYYSNRVGRHGKIFKMPKFRTMHVGTPVLATHMLLNPQQFLIPLGSLLRKSSLDELPQLWSIIIGDMSLVGPRPALFNQEDLISLRKQHGVDQLLPGLTGLAQISGRDELSIAEKVEHDIEYLKNRSFCLDMRILALTFIKVFKRSGVSH